MSVFSLLKPAGSLGLYCALLAMTCFVAGCGPTDAPKPGDDHGHEHEEGDHDHDEHDEHGEEAHVHGPAGPHGGHTESFDQPGFTFEWIHENDKQLVRIIILDEAKKEAVKVAATEVTIVSTKGREPQTFKLPAVEPDADGKASEFALTDGQLLVALNLGVDLSIDIDGKTYSKTLEPHNHDH